MSRLVIEIAYEKIPDKDVTFPVFQSRKPGGTRVTLLALENKSSITLTSAVFQLVMSNFFKLEPAKVRLSEVTLEVSHAERSKALVVPLPAAAPNPIWAE